MILEGAEVEISSDGGIVVVVVTLPNGKRARVRAPEADAKAFAMALLHAIARPGHVVAGSTRSIRANGPRATRRRALPRGRR